MRKTFKKTKPTLKPHIFFTKMRQKLLPTWRPKTGRKQAVKADGSRIYLSLEFASQKNSEKPTQTSAKL